MARGQQLGDNDRAFLKALLPRLGMTQLDFARSASLSQGWLSGVLSGARPTAEPAMLDRMAAAALQFLKERHEQNQIEEAEALELRQGLEGYLLSGLRPGERDISTPGGAVPARAVNYVTREVEREILDCLKQNTFTLAVEGPPQCGITTLLKRLEVEADKDGVEVAFLDCQEAAPKDLPATDREADEAMDRFCSFLAEMLAYEWGFGEVPGSIGRPGFPAWLRQQMASGRYKLRLLILDDLTAVGPRLALQIMSLIRVLHNARAEANLPVNFAIGMNCQFETVWDKVTRSSSYSVVYPQIQVDWFSEDEYTTWFKAITGEEARGALFDSLWGKYGGQPYLTHLAYT